MNKDVNKQLLINELIKEPFEVIATAYVYAKSCTLYGIDITKALETAVQQTEAFNTVYRKGYYDALKRGESMRNYEGDKQEEPLSEL